MGTGFQATFVLSWSQTEVDGLTAAPADRLVPGAVWRWTGVAVRVDGPQAVLLLEGAAGRADLHRRAARMVRRLVGAAIARDADPLTDPRDDDDDDGHGAEPGFVLTDGRQTWRASVIGVDGTQARLVMFLGAPPPVATDLWVVRADAGPVTRRTALHPALICFADGAQIRTATGLARIEDLCPGDLVQTADNGLQPVIWAGHRHLGGGRLWAEPHLRPVRFRGAQGGDLLVSPDHRMLVRGRAAQALFNAPEVLVAAADLVDAARVRRDHALTQVTYRHILFARPQIVWANGLETDTFLPSPAALAALDPVQRRGLLSLQPDLDAGADPGPCARRALSAPEAAILRHDAA